MQTPFIRDGCRRHFDGFGQGCKGVYHPLLLDDVSILNEFDVCIIFFIEKLAPILKAVFSDKRQGFKDVVGEDLKGLADEQFVLHLSVDSKIHFNRGDDCRGQRKQTG